jgi:hypothetical protein
MPRFQFFQSTTYFLFITASKLDKVIMAMQKQPRLGNFLDSAYDFGKNNKNKKWFKEAISQMGLKEKWITKDQSNNRLVKILLFFSLILLIIANIVIAKCYNGCLELKKPNWIKNDGVYQSKFLERSIFQTFWYSTFWGQIFVF